MTLRANNICDYCTLRFRMYATYARRTNVSGRTFIYLPQPPTRSVFVKTSSGALLPRNTFS